MKQTTSTKRSTFIGVLSSALVALSLFVIPTNASAAPVCVTAGGIKSCQGKTSDGASYAMQAPLNFNGTAFLYSKGYRYPISIPGVWDVAASSLAEQVPGRSAAEKTEIATYLLSKGYGIFSSAYTKTGWNADGALKTNIELIDIWKKEFTNTKKIVAWGESQGGFITQALAEAYPDLIDVAVPMCMVGGSVEAALKMAGDALWGMKVFFDPTIKGGGYSAGVPGVVEQLTDISKIAAALTSLSGAVVTGAWPATSKAPDAIKAAIPSRSAVTLVGQMAGLPNISAHIDGSSGPGDPTSLLHAQFVAGVAPAIATLENLQAAAILGVLIIADLEGINGGRVYDNTAADYEKQLGDGKFVFSSALSGFDAADALLAYLKAAPRETANPAALTKMRAMLSHKGVVKVPTIAMTAPYESTTPGGHVQWLINANKANIAAAKKAAVSAIASGKAGAAPKDKLMVIWNLPADKYTKFTATGSPDTSLPAANGTTHCNYTVKQYTTMAEIGALAATAGGLPSPAQVRILMRKAGGLSFDRTFEAPLLKFYATE
jgi:pimeloyl-ACP methyl ester carboxylesterase